MNYKGEQFSETHFSKAYSWQQPAGGRTTERAATGARGAEAVA
jgi:hypothetical protein